MRRSARPRSPDARSERARYAELASVACERLAELQAKQGRWNARSKRGSKLLAWSRGMKRITAS
jgi:hypothetical protein